MPKADTLKVIDQRSSATSGSGGTVVISDNVDRVDGFHAFATPRAGALLALDADARFPASVMPGATASTTTISGHHGVQFFGPTCYNVERIGPDDTTVKVTLPLFAQNDTALYSKSTGYEYVIIAGPGVRDGQWWVYPVTRAQLGTAPQEFPPYSELVNLGPPGTGGHILVDSASSPKSPSIKVRSNNPDRSFKFHGLFGRLAEVPAGFRAAFPGFTTWDTDWGFATENGFLRGGIHALYGDIAGDLRVSGTLTVQGPSQSALQLGRTVSGWGWTLRGDTGRPLIQALAPFVNASGAVVSDVAFMIDNGGKPGLSYLQIPGTDEHRLEIGVDTLVQGTLRVGETFMVGTGVWGTDFAGVAIDSDWGLVGMSATDTWGKVPQNGTYQVWWDKATGKLHTGGGVLGFGFEGMTFHVPQISAQAFDDPETLTRPMSAKWVYGADKVSEVGSLQQGQFFIGLWGDVGGENRMQQSVWFDVGSGLQLRNDSAGTYNRYIAPAGGSHLFYVGDELAFQVGKGGGLSLPITLVGSEFTNYWTATGRLGLGIDEPLANLHIEGGATIPQLRISHDDLWTTFRVGAAGTTWSTSGDVILGPATNTIRPYLPYGVNLGTPYNKFLSIHAAQLEVETLVAQSKIATIGGRVIIAPTTQLTVDVQPGDVVIFVKHNQPASGDRLLFEDAAGVEAMALTSGPTAAAEKGYRYNVTRNLNAGAVRGWPAGAAAVNTGTTGDGWIEQYAATALANGTAFGPTIVGNVRTGTTWNAWSERWAEGNMTGLYGYTGAGPYYGVAFGNPLATHITIDDVNGYRLRNNTTTVAEWDASGNLTLGATGAVQITAAGAATFAGRVTAGTGNNIVIIDPNDALYRIWAGAALATAAPWKVTQTGFMTASSGLVGGWTLGTTQLTGGNATLSATGVLTLGTGNNVIIMSAADATYRLWAGNVLPASASFKVTTGGIATMTGANISGTVTMTGGTIGGVPVANVAGWGYPTDTTKIDGGTIFTGSIVAAAIAANTITAAKIAAGTITTTQIAANTITAGNIAAGAITASELGAYSVIAGKILAGSIGASEISVNSLSSLSANLGNVTAGQIVVGSTNKLWLNDAADGWLAIGGTTKASAPFRVTAAGVLTAFGATITGNIVATTGTLGGFTVGSDYLTAGSGGNYVMMSATGYILVGATGVRLSGSGLSMMDNTWRFSTSGTLTASDVYATGYFADGHAGMTQAIAAGGAAGQKTFYFTNGILTAVTSP